MNNNNATSCDAINLNDQSSWPRECFRRDFREYARAWLLDCFGDVPEDAERIRLANAYELVRHVECHHEGGVLGFIACTYDTHETSPRTRATELGTEAGEVAASWLFDGNTDHDVYVAFLVGIEEGDPEVLDNLPAPDLSGEWADSMTPAHLAEACGVEDCDATLDDLCAVYEQAFTDAVAWEVERIAREHVEDPSTAIGRLMSAAREHSGMSYAELRQAGEHGADAGWAGFTYTADCVRFYQDNLADVWCLLCDVADDFGLALLSLVASFNRAGDVTDYESFANLLAWFALEECGRSLVA